MGLSIPIVLAAALVVGSAWAQHPPSTAQNPSEILDRARLAHGGAAALNAIEDSVFEGTITYFTVDGPGETFAMTLVTKRNNQVQRIIKMSSGELREGTDGVRGWYSTRGLTAMAAGKSLHFIESQTVRSIRKLFATGEEGATLKDAGVDRGARVVEKEDREGRKTRYFVEESSRITRVEALTGQYNRDPFTGAAVPRTDAYVFSDYRIVGGVLTPFRIDRYINGKKAEEMRFRTGLYNVAVNDDVFKP